MCKANTDQEHGWGQKLLRLRRGIQLVMLGILGNWAFYGIFRCPFLVPVVNCQECPVITCWGRITAYFWGFWLLLPASVIFFGRAFCGWLCPGGFVNQMIGKLSLFKLRKKHRLAWLAPAGMLISVLTVLVLWLVFDNPRSLPPIRVGDFWGAIYLTFHNASYPWLVRSFVVLGIIAGGLLVSNLWCRFACPLGGTIELFKRVAIFRFFKTSACDGCNACQRKCEMGTRPDERSCNNCGACVSTCPKGAIQFGRKEKKHD